MSDPDLAIDAGRVTPTPKASFWLRELPYVIVLGLVLAGAFIQTVTRTPPVGLWEFMALVIGATVVSTAWAETEGRAARTRLVITQALHWIAFLAAMNISLLPDIQRVLNPESTGITLLLLLALGTVTAGINILSWQIAFIGVVICLSVLLKVWLQQSAIIIVIGLIVALVGAGVVFSCRRNARRQDGATAGGKD